MSGAEISAIIQIVAALTPPAIKLVTDMVEAFKTSTPEERKQLLDDLAASLQPMIPKP